MTFEELKISKSILKAVVEMGFEAATAVQKKAIPPILSGKDVVGIAQTGTGKTAAYLLPILTKLVKHNPQGVRALVLVPTRELAIQVGADLENFLCYSNLQSAAIYGGVGISHHQKSVEEGIDILAATPGRLWDIYRTNSLKIKNIKHLIIDEADRMLDMGFLPQIHQLMEVLPVKRQNLLFSATFSDKVATITEDFLSFPTKIEVAPSGTPAANITLYHYKVPNYRTKINLLVHLLSHHSSMKRVLIFCRTKEQANAVYKVVTRKEQDEVRVIHSNKGQMSRINAVADFKKGEVKILISTDVAARGLDIAAISHIVNFDMPTDYDNFVHRIGRTARASAKGTAISFVNKPDEYHLRKIEKRIRRTISEQPIPDEVEIIPTEKAEMIDMERAIDKQKRREDPTFKGAFHEKKHNRNKKDKKRKRP